MTAGRLAALTEAGADWAGLRVLVAGIDPAGFAAADALLERGAQVVVVDPRTGRGRQERATILRTLGARVLLGEDAGPESAGLGQGGLPDVLVAGPRCTPDDSLPAAAAAAGVPVWSEAELAWRMRSGGTDAPWLTLTGGNGKTTTARLLESMLRAGGRRAIAAGGDGIPLLEAVLHPQPYEAVAVELPGAELGWSGSVRPLASACLNVATGALPVTGNVYQNTEIACVYNVADRATEQLVRDADVVDGCRAIGFTLGIPGLSMLGVVEDVLCDRAFVPERATSAAELGTLDDVRLSAGTGPAPHHVANALAAAALARAFGVPPVAVRDGLRGHRPGPHRGGVAAQAGGVVWVDDAAAADPVAAAAALSGFEPVVWVAGGPAGGQPSGGFDHLVTAHHRRLRAVVLVGPGRGPIRRALARHAPDVPVVEMDVTDTGPVALMRLAVDRAVGLARPGDTVLLAPGLPQGPPGSAAELGDAFGAAARGLAGGSAVGG